MKLKTIGQLKNLLKNIDDDFFLEISIMNKIPDNELLKSLYPFPWKHVEASIEFHDIGQSDKIVCFGVYDKSSKEEENTAP